MTYIAHWSPWFLALTGALATVTALLPTLKTGVGLRRWYTPLVVGALLVLGGAVVAVVVVSSPWLLLGVLLVGMVIASVVLGVLRVHAKAGQEAVGFVQALVNVMSADLDLQQAVRMAAVRPGFARAFPRMAEQARLISAELDSGRRLSVAIDTISRTLPGSQREVWEQIAILARMVEEEGLPLGVQRETLRSYWEILMAVQEANADMRREMSQMNAAKVLFLIIIPGLNIYMWQTMSGYEAFVTSLLGQVILGIEAFSLLLIFVIMSYLQRFPEVEV